jgi:hypothetical protein
MSNFLRKSYLVVGLITVLSSQTIHSQLNTSPTFASLTSNKAEANDAKFQIKWSWQLPAPVRTGFYNSSYTKWYIEKMIREVSNNETVYKFYVNNGSLLDSDHYDSFLQRYCIMVSDKGTVVSETML